MEKELTKDVEVKASTPKKKKVTKKAEPKVEPVVTKKSACDDCRYTKGNKQCQSCVEYKGE